MSVTVTRTKIHIPRRRDDLLSRSRLTKVLDDLLDYPFNLISAPAGYGKTSLMIDLAHQAQFPVCWYSIDHLDREPQRFLVHLIRSIQVQFPGSGDNFLSLVEDLSDPSKHIDQLVATLVNDLILGIGEHFAIFLDDFNLLDNQPAASAFISQFGQQMDDNVHLVIASRNKFGFPDLPLLIGRGMVRGIDVSDLAFRSAEIKTYLENKLDQPITLRECQDLEKKTEGWITGLLLVAHQGSSFLTEENKALRVTGANIKDYFASQVFEIQPSALQKQMLKTALLDEFNAEVCGQAIGEGDEMPWADFIEMVLENNLFVELIEDDGPWLRYHNLFRDFLLEKLAQDKEEERKLLSKVCSYHLDCQEWEKSFAAARMLKDPLTMAEVINQASSPLFHAGRINLLAEWLEILPGQGYSAYPLLKVFKGAIYTIMRDPITGLDELNRALGSVSQLPDVSIYLKGLVSRATAYRLLGQYDKALSDISEITKTETYQQENLNVYAEAFRESGLIFNHIGNYSEAINSFNKSLVSYSHKYDRKNIALVHLDLGLVLMDHGSYDEANHHFRQALNTWSIENNLPKLSILYNNLGMLKVLTGNFREGKEFINKAKNCAELTANIRMLAFVHASLGDLSLALHMPDMGSKYYIEALNYADRSHEAYLIRHINIHLGSCFRLLNNYPLAKQRLFLAEKKIKNNTSQTELDIWHFEQGLYFLDTGAINQSSFHFETALKSFRKSTKPLDTAKAQFGLFLCELNTSSSYDLETQLEDFFHELAQAETHAPLLPFLSGYRQELKQAAAHFPGLPGLDHLLAEIEDFLDELPALQRDLFPQETTPAGSDQLELQAFGRISARRGGQRISTSEWIHQRTARELLFFLLDQSGGVTKEQVGLVFWPDSSPAQLSCQFKNAIYRLRKALGKDAILYSPVTHSYQFNREIEYSYDVEEFSALCRQAEREGAPERKTTLYRQAVGLYKHPFAAELEGVWAEPLRRRLYLDYEKAQLTIAEELLDSNKYQACIDICKTILDIEPCSERTYQLCMRSYAGLGDKTGLRRIYEKCNNDFLAILSTKPTHELNKLYKELL